MLPLCGLARFGATAVNVAITSASEHCSMPIPAPRAASWAAIAALPFLLAWDASDLDMLLAHWYGGPGGFALKDDWL